MLLIAPHQPIAISAAAANLLTPSPREVWSMTDYAEVHLDFGAARRIDAVFFGSIVEATSGAAIWLDAELSAGVWTPLGTVATWVPDDRPGPRNVALLFNPVTSRRVRLRFYEQPGSFTTLATVMIGHSFFCPHERGSGRHVIDTGQRETLIDGGFGGEEGVTKRAVSWRFCGRAACRRRGSGAM